MGNPQHLEWLLEGVESWNKRREQEPFIPDLGGVDIRLKFIEKGLSIDNSRIPLLGANFASAVLNGANLGDSNLQSADLEGSNCHGTIFRNAGLQNANLRFANLESAKLRHAMLQNAELNGALLRGVNFQSAMVDGCKIQTVWNGEILVRTNLGAVHKLSQKQLNSMNGDTGTIIPNHLKSPLHWPKWRDDLDGESSNETVPPFIFLSYSNQNRINVQAHIEAIDKAKIPYWWDGDLAGGDTWRNVIAEKLHEAAVVLTFWTKDSVVSKAVIEEASTAQAHGKLVHVRLDDAPLPYGFAETQYIDLRKANADPNHPQIQSLIQTLKDRLDPPSKDEMRDRIERTSPIGFVPKDGKLTPKDTPVDARPEVENKADLDARLIGLRDTVDDVSELIADRTAFQLPEDFYRRLARLTKTLSREPLTWYALKDSRDSLVACMNECDAKNTWNDGIVRDLNRVNLRILELRTLLQPPQVPVGEEGAKPPETEPTVKVADIGTIEEVAADVSTALEMDADAVLNEAAMQTVILQLDALQDADKQTFGDAEEVQKYQGLRKGIKGLVYTLGGIIAGVAVGVSTNLLTAPEAAQTLATQLQTILERLLGFF